MVSMAAVSTLSWPDSGVAGAGAGAGRGQEGEVGGTAEFLREMGAERDQEGEGDRSSSEPRCGEGEVIRLDTRLYNQTSGHENKFVVFRCQ